MQRTISYALAGCMVLALFCDDASAQQGEITAAEVIEAIDRGVAFLKEEQDDRGRWEDHAQFNGGVTALSTLALLNSGVPPSDPAIQKSLAFLRNLPPATTYVVSLQTMVLAAAEPSRDLVQIQRNVRWLEAGQISDGPYTGSWGYHQTSMDGDNSNAQFAVLALHEAERAGADVNPLVWQRAHEYWLGQQHPNGAWGYKPAWPARGSMTCAGIGTLVITSSKVSEGDAQYKGGQVQCCTPQENDAQQAIERGLQWLANNFAVSGNPIPSQRGPQKLYHFYYLYGLERVGRLSGRRLIGKNDWYRMGADYLVRDHKQRHVPSWVGAIHAEHDRSIATSFALLFLSKGRRPVVVAKAMHPPDDDWNHHRRDVANLTAFTEKAWGLDLTWQIYDVRAASANDLLQTPVLLISGSQAPELAGQEEKLREYIDRGGTIFAEACCSDNSGFDQGFRDLMKRVFPEPEYQLRRIEPSHPIWRAERVTRPDSAYAGKLWSIEYGCRTCVVFSELDLSCYWELHGWDRDKELPPRVNQRVGDALTVGLNVLTYATGREPKHKEENFTLQTESTDDAAANGRGVIQIAKLQHGGGSHDAPGALANLLRVASQGELRLRVSPQQKLIPITEEALRNYHIVFMHGRNEFQLSDQQREALRQYIERGGTLLADSICASPAFANAFRREMKQVFADEALQRIPPTDELLNPGPDLGGFNLQSVTRREPIAAGQDAPLATRQRKLPPELEGIQLDGRWAVVFSPLDLSCALEKHESLQCRGYSRDDAARIALNVILYALNW